MFKTFRNYDDALSYLNKHSDHLLFLIENLEEYAIEDGVQYIVCCETNLIQLEDEFVWHEILETN